MMLFFSTYEGRQSFAGPWAAGKAPSRVQEGSYSGPCKAMSAMNGTKLNSDALLISELRPQSDAEIRPAQRCFFGCPFFRISSFATCLGLESKGNGFGRRFTARGSIPPERKPTRGSAIKTSKALMATVSCVPAPCCYQAIQTCTVCLKLSCRGI
jgi:hypothetical protein